MKTENTSRALIHKTYNKFDAPEWVAISVARLLDGIPQEHLVGIGSILLTESGTLSRARRRWSKIRKTGLRGLRGTYMHKHNGQSAGIELFVDNILEPWPTLPLKSKFVQDICIARVLYHELGHHIHHTSAPEHGEHEAVADAWESRLVKHYFRQRYRFMTTLFLASSPLLFLVQKFVNFMERREASKSLR